MLPLLPAELSLLQVLGLEILVFAQAPRINLGFAYLSRGFEVIWLLPRGLLGLSVVVISSSIRGFVLRPRGFLGKFQAKLTMNKRMGSNSTKTVGYRPVWSGPRWQSWWWWSFAGLWRPRDALSEEETKQALENPD